MSSFRMLPLESTTITQCTHSRSIVGIRQLVISCRHVSSVMWTTPRCVNRHRSSPERPGFARSFLPYFTASCNSRRLIFRSDRRCRPWSQLINVTSDVPSSSSRFNRSFKKRWTVFLFFRLVGVVSTQINDPMPLMCRTSLDTLRTVNTTPSGDDELRKKEHVGRCRVCLE